MDVSVNATLTALELKGLTKCFDRPAVEALGEGLEALKRSRLIHTHQAAITDYVGGKNSS